MNNNIKKYWFLPFISLLSIEFLMNIYILMFVMLSGVLPINSLSSEIVLLSILFILFTIIISIPTIFFIKKISTDFTKIQKVLLYSTSIGVIMLLMFSVFFK